MSREQQQVVLQESTDEQDSMPKPAGPPDPAQKKLEPLEEELLKEEPAQIPKPAGPPLPEPPAI